MRYLIHRPAAPVSRYVDHLWFYDGYTPPRAREKLLPDGAMELVIDLDGAPKRLSSRGERRLDQDYKGAWLSGLQTEFLVIEIRQSSSMMGVHFRTLGAAAFFDPPMAELAKNVVELETLLGAEAGRLREGLLEAPAPEMKLLILEHFLACRVTASDGDAQRKERLVGEVIERLRRPEGPLTVEAMAGELGITRRHLARLFHEKVGLTPKALGRILRFQRVVEAVEAGASEAIRWADLAYRCGYYDQAHFSREFRAFAGISPTDYLLRRGDYRNWINVD